MTTMWLLKLNNFLEDLLENQNFNSSYFNLNTIWCYKYETKNWEKNDIENHKGTHSATSET